MPEAITRSALPSKRQTCKLPNQEYAISAAFGEMADLPENSPSANLVLRVT
jgi:hypothetical protein